MRWYGGGIVDAVNLSKSRNAYFVVYVEGTDEKSIAMTKALDQPEVATKLEDDSKFVAIKVKSDSEAYKQFAQIYVVVPVPSLFFIGNNGGVERIVVSDDKDLSEVLVTTVDQLLEKKGFKLSSSSVEVAGSSSGNSHKTVTSDFISAEKGAVKTENQPKTEATTSGSKTPEDGYEVICDGEVCRKVKIGSSTDTNSKTNETVESDSPLHTTESTEKTDPELTIEQKVEHAKELLEKKRREKMEEEKQKEKEKELERRAQGQGVAELKRWQQEQELKTLKEERLKEKQENEKARARILQQIAQDRAEKQGVSVSTPSSDSMKNESATKPVTQPVESNVTRIQFKMADGSTHTTQQDPDSTLGELRNYVRQNVQTYGSFTLSTMYPRQILNEDQDSETLRSLELHPSSVLLLLKGIASSTNTGTPGPVASNGGILDAFKQFWWSFVFQPVYGLWVWISSYFSNPRSSSSSSDTSATSSTQNTERVSRRPESNDRSEPKRRRIVPSGGTTSIKRDGNTYRLKDNDSDDENNTWNGNSTQQM